MLRIIGTFITVRRAYHYYLYDPRAVLLMIWCAVLSRFLYRISL